MGKSLPVMNVPSGPMSSTPTALPDLGCRPPDRRQLDHAPVSLAAGPVSSSLASGVKIMPGLVR
jgi:hypothetical protein